ncbi:alpha/beta fold hydrolase [Martelella sp. AMO21009]
MQAQDRFANLNGMRMCYRQDGPLAAPAVILVAGLGMQLIEWPEELVAGLAKQFWVIRLDNRDSGLSGRCGGPFSNTPKGFSWSGSAPELAAYGLGDMAGDVLALADQLGIQTFDCVGFSMGGMIAQHLAIRAPKRLKRLVSVSSTGGSGLITADPVSLGLMERFFLPFASDEARVAAIIDSNDHFSLGLMSSRSPQSRKLAEALAGRADDEGGYLRQALAMTGSPAWRAELESLATPALFVHGDLDPCINDQEARQLADSMPCATFRSKAGLGHWIDNATSRLILAWLEAA